MKKLRARLIKHGKTVRGGSRQHEFGYLLALVGRRLQSDWQEDHSVFAPELDSTEGSIYGFCAVREGVHRPTPTP